MMTASAYTKTAKAAVILAFVLCLLFCVGATSARAADGAATVTASALYMRSKPSTTSSAVTCLSKGTTVIVLDKNGGWYKVWCRGQEGYMSADYLSASQTANAAFGSGAVKGSSVNIRSGASTASSVLGSVSTGKTLSVTGVSGDWYKVSYNGSTGYIHSDYLTLSAGESSSSSAGAPVADAVSGTGTVKGSYVNVRSGPSTASSVLGSVNSGKTLPVTGVSGDWYKVTYNGSAAYVNKAYMTLSSGGSSASSPAETALSGSGVINGSYVRMRSGPSTSYSILGSYNQGTSMTVTGASGDWYKVSYNGAEGYVYKTYLTLSSGDDFTVTDQTATEAVVTGAVHMRTGPDTSYTSMRVLGAGAKVTITGSSGKWYRISYNGAEGYCFNTYLSTNVASSVTSSASASSAGEALVNEAKKYLGVRYVYGGTSPSGFDCSGFVYYVYKQCGYSITRTATAQNSDGSYVSRSELQPGDIIIFYNSAKSAIGHAGIYIGDGQFIHASSGSGKVVITSLSASYYDTHYYSARRVVK